MAREKEIRVGDGAVVIPAHELSWHFVRSGGPGGQNVNRTSSKAVLRYDVRNSPALPDPVRRRLMALVASRLTHEGHLVITGQRFRDQPQNISDCLAKLSALVERALRPPAVRRRTKVPKSAVARRLAGKRHRGETKSLRRRPAD
jgi:ribosome-associated protein